MRPFIKARQKQERKAKSINPALGCVLRILNSVASEWRDEHTLSWPAAPPKITRKTPAPMLRKRRVIAALAASA